MARRGIRFGIEMPDFYDAIAVPYTEEGVMIEIGFSISPSTTKSISENRVRQSFRFLSQNKNEEGSSQADATGSSSKAQVNKKSSRDE